MTNKKYSKYPRLFRRSRQAALLWTALLAGHAHAGNTNLLFIRLPDFSAAPIASFPTALADLNHDNKPDLVRSVNGNQIAVQLGLGDGTFGNPTFYSVGNQATLVVVADLNNDSKPDVLVANVNDGSLSVLSATATARCKARL